ncbi:MAG: primosomal replication protein N [Gammaproteobacteria bacterium]|nr:primosomal replication protein N [Gammaproteobacteria bacterium]
MTITSSLPSKHANRVVLGGIIAKPPQTRYSPAGIAITRFLLAHESAHQEAGYPRQAHGQMLVVVAGELGLGPLRHAKGGETVGIEGFLNQVRSAQGQSRWVLHAQHIEWYT